MYEYQSEYCDSRALRRAVVPGALLKAHMNYCTRTRTRTGTCTRTLTSTRFVPATVRDERYECKVRA
eukprot:scaffold210533_cov19-Prasinocladus_malaysianus.AAC.1